jgi:hypothetical protein
VKGFPIQFEATRSIYLLECEYLQANIRLNVNSLRALQILASMRKCEGNIGSKANTSFSMYLLIIKLNTYAYLCKYFEANDANKWCL